MMGECPMRQDCRNALLRSRNMGDTAKKFIELRYTTETLQTNRKFNNNAEMLEAGRSEGGRC